MIRKLTANSSLDSLKKEAKRWLKSLRAGDSAALARLQSVLPKADATAGLRELQQALAREHGAASWAALKLQLSDAALARRTHAERLEEFLEHAIINYGIPPGDPKWDPSYGDDPSRRAYAARILTKHPELVRDSIHVAVLAGDIAEVERVLKRDASAASRKGGNRQWEPLLYLAYGRLPIAAASDNAVSIASLLLVHGADPNVKMTDGLNPFTVVTGCIGEGERPPAEVPPHPRAVELVRLLVERGADPFDTQAFYNTSLWHDSAQWLDFLFEYDERAGRTARWNVSHDGQPGQLDYLLGNAVTRNHVKRVEWLLAHGANPQAKHAYTKRNLHTTAVLHGFTELAQALAAAGTATEALVGREAFQAACLRMDTETAQRLAQQHPEFLADADALHTAARSGRVDAVDLLLRIGVSPDVVNANGERALHSATWSDSVPLAQRLIAGGATIDAQDRHHHSTPLGWSVYFKRVNLIDYLSTVSRDIGTLIVAGKLERVSALLQEEPALATTRHGDMTVLFALPEGDEDLAIELAQLLITHGADPQFKRSQGTTAADEAERRGHDALAHMLREVSGNAEVREDS